MAPGSLDLYDAAKGVELLVDLALFELAPFVVDMNDLATDVVGPFAGQEEGQLELLFWAGAAGHADLFGVLDFLPSGAITGGEDFVGHRGVGAAGGEAVDLHIVFGDFGGEELFRLLEGFEMRSTAAET